MADAEDVIELVAFEALNVPDVKALADVFQHVPDNHELEDPGDAVLIIGDMESEAYGAKGSSDEKVSLTIAALVVAAERKPIRALKAKVKEKLDRLTVSRNGWTLAFTFAGGDGFRHPESHEIYAGNFRFDVLALSET